MTVAAETYLMQGGGWDHGKGGKITKDSPRRELQTFQQGQDGEDQRLEEKT